MRNTIFLKRFDNHVENDTKPTLETELLRIQAEQENILKLKLQESEKKIYEEVSKKLEKKYQDDLKNNCDEILQKHTQEINQLRQKIQQDYTLYTDNCIKIMEVFLNHHLRKLNCNIICQEVLSDIKRLLQENQKSTIKIVANDTMLDNIKSHITTIENDNTTLLNYDSDNQMADNQVEILYEGRMIHFSSEAIMNYMNDVFTNLMRTSK